MSVERKKERKSVITMVSIYAWTNRMGSHRLKVKRKIVVPL